MKLSEYFLLSCILGAVKCSSYCNIDPSAQIDRTAYLGDYNNIAARVIIGEYVVVGSYASIDQYSSFGRNSKIGDYASIGANNVIENDVIMKSYCKIGNRNTFKPGSVLYNYVNIADNVTIDKNAQIHQYSSIANGARIGEDVICDDYSSVGPYVNVHLKAYIGNYVIVHRNAIIGELAVLHEYVVIPESATVKRNQVVIRRPSSYNLYMTTDPVESIPGDKVRIATEGNTETISPEFNQMLLQLIDSDLNKISTDCQHSSFPNGPENIRRIISLYLIRYHGLNRYNENRQNLYNSYFNLVNQLQHELHLGPNSQKNILKTDVQKKLIQLIAILLDMGRGRRIANDTVCSMIVKILNGERDVVIADPINNALFVNY